MKSLKTKRRVLTPRRAVLQESTNSRMSALPSCCNRSEQATNSRIAEIPRRRTLGSLITYGYVVHIGVADGVLVAEGFYADWLR
jgi:hypothetical protein